MPTDRFNIGHVCQGPCTIVTCRLLWLAGWLVGQIGYQSRHFSDLGVVFCHRFFLSVQFSSNQNSCFVSLNVFKKNYRNLLEHVRTDLEQYQQQRQQPRPLLHSQWHLLYYCTPVNTLLRVNNNYPVVGACFFFLSTNRLSIKFNVRVLFLLSVRNQRQLYWCCLPVTAERMHRLLLFT